MTIVDPDHLGLLQADISITASYTPPGTFQRNPSMDVTRPGPLERAPSMTMNKYGGEMPDDESAEMENDPYIMSFREWLCKYGLEHLREN